MHTTHILWVSSDLCSTYFATILIAASIFSASSTTTEPLLPTGVCISAVSSWAMMAALSAVLVLWDTLCVARFWLPWSTKGCCTDCKITSIFADFAAWHQLWASSAPDVDRSKLPATETLVVTTKCGCASAQKQLCGLRNKLISVNCSQSSQDHARSQNYEVHSINQHSNI